MEDCEAGDTRGKVPGEVAVSDENPWRITEDVVEFILTRLSYRDLYSLRLCSHFFNSLCHSDVIWVQLFKRRWPCTGLPHDQQGSENTKLRECRVNGPCSFHFLRKRTDQGWQAAYAALHVELAARAKSVIDLVSSCSRNESMEVYDYQKALFLLRGLDFGFHDVLKYLLTPSQGVLVNLIGLHFSLNQLHVKSGELKAALKRIGLDSRQVCLRWWTMGGWANGFHRRDEIHICTLSMEELADPSHKDFLKVMQRGTVHEVLRVQISADFNSSAWVSPDMYSRQ